MFVYFCRFLVYLLVHFLYVFGILFGTVLAEAVGQPALSGSALKGINRKKMLICTALFFLLSP